jgi:poly-gamma-glutamate synthesis protein (capsule biosynthesis protein)
MINIVIGGDVCPIRRNLPYFRKGDVKSIFYDLCEEFDKAELSIVNLECPMINESTPIMKTGPVFGIPSDCINGLTQVKIDMVNLANNHIMDHGPTGLNNTIRVCRSAGISTVGAGENLESARQIVIKKFGRIRIGILAIAEHEFSIATDNSCGANPLDLADYVRNVKNRRGDFDYLVVLFHGGNEHYPYPSPRLKDTCHFLVEMGANTVVVQHTHCPGCYEEYQGAHIVYGQGNLIFDAPNQDKSFHEGFLVKLSIAENLNSTMEIVPYFQSNSQIGTRKMGDDAEQLFRRSLEKRSIAIKDYAFVQSQWIKFCENKKNTYLSMVLGHNRIFRKLNSHGLLVKYFYTKMSLTQLKNIVSCEAHREVLETIFNHRML